MSENKQAKTPTDGAAGLFNGVWYGTAPTCISSKPLKREWVGLTDDEVSEIIDREIGFNSCWGPEEAFARAIEARLKQKNGGEYRNVVTTEITKLNQENT
jgi:hypothetical protein